MDLKTKKLGINQNELKYASNNYWREKMTKISFALDDHNLASAYKLANEAISIKFSNPIIKGISHDDKLTFTQDQ